MASQDDVKLECNSEYPYENYCDLDFEGNSNSISNINSNSEYNKNWERKEESYIVLNSIKDSVKAFKLKQSLLRNITNTKITIEKLRNKSDTIIPIFPKISKEKFFGITMKSDMDLKETNINKFQSKIKRGWENEFINNELENTSCILQFRSGKSSNSIIQKNKIKKKNECNIENQNLISNQPQITPFNDNEFCLKHHKYF